MLRWTMSLMLSVSLLGGCGEKDDPVQDKDSGTQDDGSNQDGNSGADEDSVTYTSHIKTILNANCTRCHLAELQGADRNGAPVGIDFDNYGDASTNSTRANARIQAGSMPPGGGLDQSDRDKFQAWINQGVPE